MDFKGIHAFRLSNSGRLVADQMMSVKVAAEKATGLSIDNIIRHGCMTSREHRLMTTLILSVDAKICGVMVPRAHRIDAHRGSQWIRGVAAFMVQIEPGLDVGQKKGLIMNLMQNSLMGLNLAELPNSYQFGDETPLSQDDRWIFVLGRFVVVEGEKVFSISATVGKDLKTLAGQLYIADYLFLPATPEQKAADNLQAKICFTRRALTGVGMMVMVEVKDGATMMKESNNSGDGVTFTLDFVIPAHLSDGRREKLAALVISWSTDKIPGAKPGLGTFTLSGSVNAPVVEMKVWQINGGGATWTFARCSPKTIVCVQEEACAQLSSIRGIIIHPDMRALTEAEVGVCFIIF